MAISFVVAAGALGNVVTIPASATNGDCLIVQAVNTASTTFSASPTGCTTITRRAADSGSFLLAYTFKSAGSAANISAVGATHIGLSVYRGTANPPVGDFTSSSAAADALIDLAAIPFTVTDGSSWGVAGYFHNRTTGGIGQPVGMTERFDNISASRAAAMSDTNAGQTTFTAHTATATAARDWASITIELLALADGNRTVTAEAAAYAYTGQAVQFDIIQPSGAGAYLDAGQAAGFGVAMAAGQGSFAVDGQAVGLVDDNPQAIIAEAGAYSEAGQAAVFNVTILAAAGAFSLAGQDVTLTATGTGDTPILASAGAYVESGQPANMLIGMIAEAGTFALSGQSVADHSASVAVVSVYIGAGGGHRKNEGIDWAVDPALEQRTPEEFWSVREQYLKWLKATAEGVVPHERVLEAVAHLDQRVPAVQAIAETVAQRERAFRTAEAARTADELKQSAERVLALSEQLAEKLRMQDEEDILMLLLVI